MSLQALTHGKMEQALLPLRTTLRLAAAKGGTNAPLLTTSHIHWQHPNAPSFSRGVHNQDEMMGQAPVTNTLTLAQAGTLLNNPPMTSRSPARTSLSLWAAQSRWLRSSWRCTRRICTSSGSLWTTW